MRIYFACLFACVEICFAFVYILISNDESEWRCNQDVFREKKVSEMLVIGYKSAMDQS